MVVETFSVIPSATVGTYLIFIGPIILLIVAIGTFLRSRSRRQFLAMLVVVIALFAGVYVFIHDRTNLPAEVTIGNGYIQISSSETGTMNFTSAQISNAYVAQIGSGNLTLSKQRGLNNGVDRLGFFTTGNGSTAYVVSSVQKDLVIQLTSGNYVIVGNSNLTSMVSLFNEEVYPG